MMGDLAAALIFVFGLIVGCMLNILVKRFFGKFK
jgi:hypothetical protein